MNRTYPFFCTSIRWCPSDICTTRRSSPEGPRQCSPSINTSASSGCTRITSDPPRAEDDCGGDGGGAFSGGCEPRGGGAVRPRPNGPRGGGGGAVLTCGGGGGSGGASFASPGPIFSIVSV